MAAGCAVRQAAGDRVGRRLRCRRQNRRPKTHSRDPSSPSAQLVDIQPRTSTGAAPPVGCGAPADQLAAVRSARPRPRGSDACPSSAAPRAAAPATPARPARKLF